MYAIASDLEEQQDQPYYRMISVIGRIAQLDEMAERHWDALSPPAPPIDLHREVNHFERAHILEVLRATFGKREKAAKILGMSRRILEYRCHQLGILEGGRKDVGSVKSSRRRLVNPVNPIGPHEPNL